MSDEIPEIKQYAVLTFKFDSGDGRAKLTLEGPKVPSIGVAPAIGISRDAKGDYHFLIGGGEYVYPPKQLPGELRRLLGDSGAPKGPPTPVVPMPTKRQLQKTDGPFMTYEEYELNRKLFHSPVGNLGTIWSPMPRALYQALIDFYSGNLSRPLLPPTDYGDFPLPPDDTGMA
jgi:hypothetical protein